jgi:hypothetical protein
VAIVFTGQPGRVVALTDPGLAGVVGLVAVNPSLQYQQQRAVITRLTVSQQSNFQFLHTLGSSIYVFSFGDRVGQLTLSGLCFTDCSTGDSGIEEMLAYYNANRLAARQDQVEVIIGSTSIRGFLVGSTIDIVRPEDQLGQFALNISTLPERLS